MTFKVGDRIRWTNKGFPAPAGDPIGLVASCRDDYTITVRSDKEGIVFNSLKRDWELVTTQNPFIREKTVKTIVEGEYSSKNGARIYIDDVGKTDVRVSIGRSSTGYWFNKEDLIELADILAEIAEVLDDE